MTLLKWFLCLKDSDQKGFIVSIQMRLTLFEYYELLSSYGQKYVYEKYHNLNNKFG